MNQRKYFIFLLLISALLITITNCSALRERAKQKTAEKYAWVEFDGNGAVSGKAPADRKYIDPGEFVFMKENLGSFEKPGYTFSGWNTEPDGSGTHYNTDTYFLMGYENVILYAEWAAAD